MANMTSVIGLGVGIRGGTRLNLLVNRVLLLVAGHALMPLLLSLRERVAFAGHGLFEEYRPFFLHIRLVLATVEFAVVNAGRW